MTATLVSGDVRGTLLRLMGPMAWGIFAIVAFSFTDTFFVGKLGTEPLAALGFTFPVVMSVLGISFGIGTAGTSLISRAIGKGDTQHVKKLTLLTLLLSFFVVLVCAVLGFLTIDPLFRFLGATESVLPLIRSYMEIWYFGVVFLVIPIVGNHCIRASGDTKTPSMIMTLAAFINVVLDPLLIFGWTFFPRLEIQGAAYATLIARLFTLWASLHILIRRKKMLSFQRIAWSEAIRIWRDLSRIAVPSGASYLIVPLTSGLITAMVARFGIEAVAAYGVVTRIEQMALIVLMGASASLGPFIGQNWGARRLDRLKEGVKWTFGFSFFWGLLMIIVLAIFGERIVSLFNSDPEVIRIGRLYLLILPSVYAFEGIQMASTSTFNALGRPMAPTWVTFFRMVFIYLPLAHFLSLEFGLMGVFAANLFATLFGGLTLGILTRRLCWKIL